MEGGFFVRSELNPILRPNLEHPWESGKLYNPGVIFFDGKFHLFYRAMICGEDWYSSIGYAASSDGENFERFTDPILMRESESEKRGLEDPRITEIDWVFYMAYAAYDGNTPRLSVATSRDLKTWEKHGPAFTDWMFAKAGGVRLKWDEDGNCFEKPKLTEWSKSGGIFPEKIGGKFLMMFGEYRIWFASSDDGIHWNGDQQPFLEPRTGDFFDNAFVEMGPPPIKTEMGWLVLYHGIDMKQCYRIGFLILDLEDPRKIIFRSQKPIFEPEEDYEMNSIIDVLPGGMGAVSKMSKKEFGELVKEYDRAESAPHVTFCCGAVLLDKQLRIFYGAADAVICTATADIDDILNLVKYENS